MSKNLVRGSVTWDKSLDYEYSVAFASTPFIFIYNSGGGGDVLYKYL